ncbi:MAG: ATP-binding protein [Trichodesmium sp.]
MLRYHIFKQLALSTDSVPIIQLESCFLHPPWVAWLDISSNTLIALAFYLIAALIIYFIQHREDIPTNWVFSTLAITILSYATTHLIEIWNLWFSSDLFVGYLQAINAIISILIASLIIWLIPTILTIPSPNQLKLVNTELTREIKLREEVEKSVDHLNALLEKRVKNRTAALTWMNNKLCKTIKQHQKIEEKLQLTQFVVERSADAVFWITKDGKVIYVNDAACHSLGYSPEEMLDLTIHDINPDFPENSWYLHWNLLKKCGNLKIEAYHLTKHNQKFPVEITLNHLEFKGEEYQCAFARDISDRQKAEIALRQSEARERNKAEQLELALKELRQTQTQLIHTEKMSSLGQLIAGIAHEINNPISFIYGNTGYGKKYITDILELIGIYQKHYPNPESEIQSYIEEIELDFVKEDLPKIMSSMQMGAERIRSIVLSLRNFARLDESDKKLVNIHDGIDSTLLILKNRLNLVTGLAKGKKSEPIQVMQNYGDVPFVECYPGQMNQVFMNILNNAIDALEMSMLPNSWINQNQRLQHNFLDENKQDKTNNQKSLNQNLKNQNNNLSNSIEISVGASNNDYIVSSNKSFNKLLDLEKSNNQGKRKKPTISISTELVDDNLICIRIADNGIGINEEICQRIFDPFFTTKQVGKGTGLGLAISYQIVVEKHGGNIQCNSILGKGSEFVIQIPVKLNQQKKMKSLNKAG